MPGHIVLSFVEENSHEYLDAIEDNTEAMIRQLEEQRREARPSWIFAPTPTGIEKDSCSASTSASLNAA